MNENILNKLRYAGTYQDDGLTIFRERLSHRQAIHWLCHFQIQVNKLVGGDYFQFTAEIWNPLQHNNLPTLETMDEILPDEEWRRWKKKVKLVDKDAFPYLDMQLQQKDDNLSSAVYHKKNQTIKYVNRESCHRTAVFKAIPAGVFTHMGQLTSMTEENKNVPITYLYPTHADALRKANILPKKIPMVHKLYKQELVREEMQKKKVEEKNRRHDKRTIYFVIGHA
eukprot:4325039-Ditylum_brightwellii.AAC.1